MEATSPPPPESTDSNSLGEDDPFEEITEDGVEWLAGPVTAQKEGVYQYPTSNGVSREYVDGDDLTAEAGSGWDGVPLTLRHPVVNRDGKPTYGLTSGPQASYTTVGEFRDSDRSTDDALRGRVWIKQDQVGLHDGLLEDYIEDVRSGEYGDVSPGYSAPAVNEYGSFDGQSYNARQTNVMPDHVALLPDESGNCSIADGCGVGRTNTNADGPEPQPRLNAAPVEVSNDSMTPDPADDVAIPEEDISRVQSAWSTLNDVFGRTNANESDTESEAGGESEGEDESGGNEPAESGAEETDTNSMTDKTKTLVEEHDFDEENLPDEGEDCFDRIYDKFAGEESEESTETETEEEESESGTESEEEEGVETTESPEEPESPGAETAGEGEAVVNLGDHDSLDDLVNAQVNQALEQEQSSVERQRTEEAIVNSAAPFDADDLEEMNDAAVEAIAEKHDVHSSGQASGGQSASYAGVPQPTVNADQTEDGGAPVAGYGNARSEGGDE